MRKDIIPREEFIQYFKNLMSNVISIHPNVYQSEVCIYDENKKRKIHEIYDEIISDESINTLPKYIYNIKRLFKAIDDPHTTCSNFYWGLPLAFKYIDGKLYVVDATYEYSHLTGMEVKSINGVPINIVIDEMVDIISYSTQSWRDSCVQRDIVNLCNLWILPCMKEEETFKFSFEGNGLKVDETFDISSQYGFLNKNSFYDYHVRDNVIIIRYSKCRDDEDYPFEDFVNDIIKESTTSNINDFIVDIRANMGGDSSVISPLISFLEQKNVVTLVDGEVFSSGSIVAYELKEIGSHFVGEDIGTLLNNFGELKTIYSSNPPIIVQVSSKYFFVNEEEGQYWSVEGKDEYDDFFGDEKNVKYLEPQKLDIDLKVPYTISDILNKKDSMMEAALEYIKVKKVL